ncbi:peptidoglycan-binding protein [Scytonema sp. UIC 10036]|uniref:peptidoglycan-binding domain-containing protein n=1 Tax=Scytonema sp. UIC 10036 TaxID=2304196 RepID=UPI0012DA9146|nr:peptidoglycan-binding domain-containing protein [Scytonema sp. UIC 10036]MUH01168.1 peptidoglycan-binding protein [Scytonema sp. UIC 10036]
MESEVKASAVREVTTVRRGDTGSAVRLLQNILISLGYLGRDLNTGNFLEQTDDAVRNFQADNSLRVDGIVGPRTWDLLGSRLWD